MVTYRDESTNEKHYSLPNHNPLTPILSVNDEELIEEMTLNLETNLQHEATHIQANDLDRSNVSDSLTENFVKMQNEHISQSKSNKYEYTPLQFAKSLFDRMVADCGVASERKNYIPHKHIDSALDSFITPDVSLIKRNFPYINAANDNPILNALKLNSDNFNNSIFQNAPTSYQDTPVDTAKLAQKYVDELYVNGNYVPEFNSEYEGTDRNINLSFVQNSSLNCATPNTMPYPTSLTFTPKDGHDVRRKNLVNILEGANDENVNAANESRLIISPSKLLNLEAKINNRKPLIATNCQNINKHPINHSSYSNKTTIPTSTSNERPLLSMAKNPLTHVINRNKTLKDTNATTNNENYDQVDAFKNYVISGKVDDNLSLKLRNSNINGALIKIPDNSIEPQANAVLNNIPIAKQPNKTHRRNFFTRLFRRLRQKNRFHSHLNNDTITSLNTEFNRSYLNKTASDVDTHKKSCLNSSVMEVDCHSLKSHSKSVNFAPSTQSGGSLIEEFDRDQRHYDALKEQANISNVTFRSEKNAPKQNSDRCTLKGSSNYNPTILTFYIGADEVPFKTEIKVDPSRITLKMIKNVLPKLGKRTKYYFKVEDPNNRNDYYKEIANDSDMVPLFEGQPVCKFFSHG